MSPDQQLIPKRKIKVPKAKLEAMFRQQRRFQARFYRLSDMTVSERQAYLQLMLTCINVEQVEALNWLSWKPWRKQVVSFNRYEFINELVDIQHFLINCLLAVGCTPRQFTKQFLNKGKENVARQKRSY